MRVMGLDFGVGRCGVAISDPTGTIATPLPAVRKVTSRPGRRSLLRLIDESSVQQIVVGLPRGLNGADTEQTVKAREFAGWLKSEIKDDISIALVDERFTTKLAQATVGQDSDEDSRAAAIILTDWLQREK